MAIGDKGAQFVTEAKKSTFREWLNNLWQAIKNALGFENVTASELQNMTLDEFASRAAVDILKGRENENEPDDTNTDEALVEDAIGNYQMTASDEVERFLSGTTIKNTLGIAPEGDQRYLVQKRTDMLQDGKNMIGIAQGIWGSDIAEYGPHLFNYIKGMSNDSLVTNKKAVLMAVFLGELKEEMNRNPQRVGELKKLDNAVTEYYQHYMNIRGKEVSAGALLRLYRDKYMGDIFANQILEDDQIRSAAALRKAEEEMRIREEAVEQFKQITQQQKNDEEVAAAQAEFERQSAKKKKNKIAPSEAAKIAEAKLEKIKSKAGLQEMMDKIKSVIDKINCK
jgi:hypothetical protein